MERPAGGQGASLPARALSLMRQQSRSAPPGPTTTGRRTGYACSPPCPFFGAWCDGRPSGISARQILDRGSAGFGVKSHRAPRLRKAPGRRAFESTPERPQLRSCPHAARRRPSASPTILPFDGVQSPAAGPASVGVSPESRDAVVTSSARTYSMRLPFRCAAAALVPGVGTLGVLGAFLPAMKADDWIACRPRGTSSRCDGISAGDFAGGPGHTCPRSSPDLRAGPTTRSNQT